MKSKTSHVIDVFLRRLLPLFAGLAALILVIAWLSGMFVEKIEPRDSKPNVRHFVEGQPTEDVLETIKHYEEEALGELKAANRSAISAKVLATIEEIRVVSGNEVTEGDLLIRLASDELKARLSQAEQAFIAAQATRSEAEMANQRMQALLKNAPNVVTDEHLQRVIARLQTVRAEEMRSEQAVAEANVRMSYTEIRAPKDGKIIERLAEPGDTALPGEPLLVLYDAQSLRLEAPVVEERAVHLKLGQTLRVRIDALDRELVGMVDEIVPQAELLSRSLLVKVSVPASDNMYEGMFGRIFIPAGTRRHLCLPIEAIKRIGQLQFVDVVLDSQEGKVLERRLITTGRLGDPGRIEVLSGVASGEEVILDGDHPTESKENRNYSQGARTSRVQPKDPKPVVRSTAPDSAPVSQNQAVHDFQEIQR